MNSFHLVAAILLVCMHVMQGTAEGTIALDKGSNQCGTTSKMKLEAGATMKVYATGNAPNGYCGALVYAVPDPQSECKYPGICARVTSSSMAGCNAKAVFAAKYNDSSKDHVEELSCYFNLGKDFCTQGIAMGIELTEDLDYAMKKDEEKTGYKFNVTLYRHCFERKEVKYVEYPEDNYKPPNLEEGWRRNYVIGIVVACCLASIFLTILVITKFYYKSRPYSGLKE